MNELIGIWMYVSLIYQGQPMPKPNPELKMTYTFYNNYINEIFYYRENETGFCKRKAEYKLQSDTIIQKVVEVDPANSFNCDQDTDMQMNNISAAKYIVEKNKLYLILPLGDETLTYVWEKQNN